MSGKLRPKKQAISPSTALQTTTAKDLRLCKEVKVLIGKIDHAFGKAQDYAVTLGQHLKVLHGGRSREAFLALVSEHIGLGRTRAYQYIEVADGKKTVEQIREDRRERDQKVASLKKACPPIGGQNAKPSTSTAVAKRNDAQDDAQDDDTDTAQDDDTDTAQDDADAVSPVSTAKQNYLAGSGNDEWHTPSEVIEPARKVLGGIDVDPASNAQAQLIVKAGAYYSIEDDGLTQQWSGTVWLNPPYSSLAPWADKLLAEIAAGRVTSAIFLSHSYTDPKWFHRLTAVATAMCFARERVWFIDPATGEQKRSNQGQMLLYFGPEVELFRSVFEADVGYVVVPAKEAKAPPAATSDVDGAKLHALQRKNLALTSELEEALSEVVALRAKVRDLQAQLTTAVPEAADAPSLVPDALPAEPMPPLSQSPAKLTKHEQALAVVRAHPELSAKSLMERGLPELEGISLPTLSKARSQVSAEGGTVKAKRGRRTPAAVATAQEVEEATATAQEVEDVIATAQEVTVPDQQPPATVPRDGSRPGPRY